MSTIPNKSTLSESELEDFLNSRSSFGVQDLLKEDDSVSLSVSAREKRPNKALHKKKPKLPPLKAPELDRQLQRELRDVPALKYDFSNETIEKMFGYAAKPKAPAVEVEFTQPVVERPVHSLFFRVDESEYFKVEEPICEVKRDVDSSEPSEEASSCETSSSTSTPSDAFCGPLRIRNAAILGLLSKGQEPL